MIKLQQKYLLRVDKLDGQTICGFFYFWSTIYMFILIMSYFGPQLTVQDSIYLSKCEQNLGYREASSLIDSNSLTNNTYRCVFCQQIDDRSVQQFTIKMKAFMKSKYPLQQQKYDLQITQLIQKSNDEKQQKELQQDRDLLQCSQFSNLSSQSMYPFIEKENQTIQQNLTSNQLEVLVNNNPKEIHFSCANDSKQNNFICSSDYIIKEQVTQFSHYIFLVKMKAEREELEQIQKLLFEIGFRNQLFDKLSIFFKCVFLIATLGFIIYTKIQLKKFHIDQQIKIHKWIKILLIVQILYNDPLNLLLLSNERVSIIRDLSEIVFITLLLYFWINTFETSNRVQLTENQKDFLIILKVLIVVLYSAGQAIEKIYEYYLAQLTIMFSPQSDVPLYGMYAWCQILVLGLYSIAFIYFVVKFAKAETVEGLASEGNHNILCKCSIIVFIVYSLFAVRDYLEPDNASTFTIYARKGLVNVYIYMITYLYLPIEAKKDEEIQYNIKKEKEEIMRGVYDDIELEETKDQPTDKNEQQKQKVWDQINKSVEDEEGEEEEQNQDEEQNKDDDKDNDFIYDEPQLEEQEQQKTN